MKLIYLSVLLAMSGTISHAATIADASRYSYGANFGWLDWNTGTNNAVVTGSVCSGWIYSANCGWINLGSGTPSNGVSYANASADDFGVNCDSAGNLRGFAYGANIGWINFQDSGGPRIDLSSGQLSGSIYGANVGWISLNPGTVLQLALSSRPNRNSNGSSTVLTWTSNPSGRYVVQILPAIQPGSTWVDSTLGVIAGSDGPTTTATIPPQSLGQCFFRIKAADPASSN